MNKATEIIFGLSGVAAIGAAVWLGFIEGIIPALVFFLFAMIFLGGFANFVELFGNAFDRIFGPRD